MCTNCLSGADRTGQTAEYWANHLISYSLKIYVLRRFLVQKLETRGLKQEQIVLKIIQNVNIIIASCFAVLFCDITKTHIIFTIFQKKAIYEYFNLIKRKEERVYVFAFLRESVPPWRETLVMGVPHVYSVCDKLSCQKAILINN